MMSRDSVLARARTAALAGMADTCTIYLETVTGTHPDTGVVTVTTATLYTGACRVQERTPPGARQVEVGESNQLLLRKEVQLPMTVTGITLEHQVRMLTCPNDADLVGKVFRIRELAGKTHASARRIGVEEAT